MDEKNEGFGSWRDDLNKNEHPKKSVDGFVSKEGFVIDEKSKAQNPKSQTIPNDQNSKIEKTPPPPPQPKPTPKPGCSRVTKFLVLIAVIVLILSILYLLFFYKSALEISVSQEGSRITLDNQSISAAANSVKPGKYTLKIEKEGFVPYQKEVEIKYFKKTSLSIILKEMPNITSIYGGEVNYLTYNKESDLYLFYKAQESAFYRLSSGEPIPASPPQIKNVVDVIWNPDRLTAVLKIKNDNAVLNGTPFYNPAVAQNEIMTYLYDFGRYDLLHQEAHFWGTGIWDIKFTPKGDQIGYYFEPGTGEKSLIIANKDNSAINRILDLRNFENPSLSWSEDLKNIVITNKSKDYSNNKIYLFNLIEKTLSPITETGDNLGAIFDSTGEKIVYAAYSSDPDFSSYSLLLIMDKDGKNKKELKTRSLIGQTIVNQILGLLTLSENKKDQYSPLAINLENLRKTEYVFTGEIISPSSIEYIESKNSIIFLDQNKAKLLFLTTKEYE